MNNNKNCSDYLYFLVRTNIKKYRKLRNMTTIELAIKSGYTLQYILNLECLKTIKRPRLDTLGIICNALNIDITQLFENVD